jgi:cytochrome c oxidase subunit 1/cytochrome c oxidase subunit I+III
MCRGRIAGDNPWQAWTLEWAMTSPPPEHNFDYLPPIRSRRPLWDTAHPDRPDPPIARPEDLEKALPEKNKVSMLTFIASEGFFFVMLIAAYVYYNVQLAQGPTAGTALDPGITGIFTAALIGSSFTLWVAEWFLHRNRHTAFRVWLIVTILLGLMFILGQGNEYAHLLRSGITISRNLFATSFFTLTGFHGLHVCIGLLALLIVLRLSFAGDFKPARTEAVRTIGLYWHFVDVVWIFVFSTVYLLGPHL